MKNSLTQRINTESKKWLRREKMINKDAQFLPSTQIIYWRTIASTWSLFPQKSWLKNVANHTTNKKSYIS